MLKERCSLVLAVGTLVAFTAVRPAHAFDEPDGFGRAKFGMPVAEVKKLYPKMKVPPVPTPKSGETVPPFPVVSYALDNQTVGPLHKCHVELNFYHNQLFEVQFRCPDKKAVTPYLVKRFGDPKPASPSSVVWQGARASVTHVPESGLFAFGDVELTKAETLGLMAYVSQFPAPKGQAPAPAAQPAAPSTTKPLIDPALMRRLTVVMGADTAEGIPPLKVHFSLELFQQLDNLVDPKVAWDFDDDSPRSHEREPTHVFTKPGNYTVRVKVTDVGDKKGTAETRIDVYQPEENAAAGEAAPNTTPAAEPDPAQPAK
jgi:hypothetical protein